MDDMTELEIKRLNNRELLAVLAEEQAAEEARQDAIDAEARPRARADLERRAAADRAAANDRLLRLTAVHDARLAGLAS